MSLQGTGAPPLVSGFMEQLSAADMSVLVLDYDGTLAPFQVDRLRAYPYPGVIELLAAIEKTERSKVVIVSGRPIAELRPLLLPLHDIEMWGSHGLEHQAVGGSLQRIDVLPDISASLKQAEDWLTETGLGDRSEIKPGGIAVHWRGMPQVRVESLRTQIQMGLSRFATHPGIKLLEFEGGLELRICQPNKGDAIRSILDHSSHNISMAYLGDDHTDEDAFQVLNSRGLTVLVRPEYRQTNAQVWLRPPEELLVFLQRWLENTAR